MAFINLSNYRQLGRISGKGWKKNWAVLRHKGTSLAAEREQTYLAESKMASLVAQNRLLVWSLISDFVEYQLSVLSNEKIGTQIAVFTQIAVLLHLFCGFSWFRVIILHPLTVSLLHISDHMVERFFNFHIGRIHSLLIKRVHKISKA